MLINLILFIMEHLIESFKYGIGPTIVIALYLIIVKIIDSRKESNKSKRTIEINKQLLDCFTELNNYLHHITKDLVEKESDKCIATIRTSFKSMAYSIIRFSNFTIINNNVSSNKKNIQENINHLINAEYSSIYNDLLAFYNEENHVIDYMQESWKTELKNDIESIIFDLSITKEQRIYNIHNKIGIRINDYIYTLTNNFLNNK